MVGSIGRPVQNLNLSTGEPKGSITMKYGQYCPVAKSLELLGDRWTLLIVRDMLTGTQHFNELERGLPGISRGLLAARLRQLQRSGIILRHALAVGRSSSSYELTEAGRELGIVLGPLRNWGEKWAFGDPEPLELDPVLLMWWLRGRADVGDTLEGEIVARFDFTGAATTSFWLILSRTDVTLCLTDPGFEIDLLVTADLAVFYRLWGGRLSYREALNAYGVTVEGPSKLARTFPRWFGWDKTPHGTDQSAQRTAVVIR